MSTQPEALRLANFLEMHWCNVDMPEAKAAAELRRQHEEITELRHGAGVAHQTIAGLVAQRDALKQTLHEEINGNLRLRDLGGARPDEPMLTFLERIIAERDALLRALKSTGLFLHHCWCDVQMNDYSFEKLNRQMEIVDAAIKAVEEGK